MIITTSWLSEYIDISALTPEDICDKLNKIGLEVASLEKHTLDKKIVIGKVLSCEKHPNADKLSVCKVDVGSEVLQIVCGAKNVRQGLFVVVSMVGSTLPNDFKIKKAKLRDVESLGMICSSGELGLPDISDGILELDDSIGKLEKGKPLDEYPIFCDTVIEVELTANRGDCLSINGVARDLKAGFNLNDITIDTTINDAHSRGIARVLGIESSDKVTSHNMYRVVENYNINSSLKIDLRLAFVNEKKDTNLENILTYATHSTGVILTGYTTDELKEDKDKIIITLTNDNGVNKVSLDGKLKSQVGIIELDKESNSDSGNSLIFEATYLDPNKVSEVVYEQRLKSDGVFYRSSRGSEPDLKFGLNVLLKELENCSELSFYSETIQNSIKHENLIINISLDDTNAKIGQNLAKNDAVVILKSLGFDVKVQAEQDALVVGVPLFRHDILCEADIVEEFVRIIGIDNIKSKPMLMTEMRNMDLTYKNYKFERDLARRTATAGFSESLHFVFSDMTKLKEYGFDITDESCELLNPITADMNSLRTSLLPNLLSGIKLNINKSKSKVGLFEIGDTFNSKREQFRKFGLIYSGDIEDDLVSNNGKPKQIEFSDFVQKISAIVGDIEIANCKDPIDFFHPGQCGNIIQNKKVVGIIGKLHPKIAKENSLPNTFVCEIDLGLSGFKDFLATPHSIYQLVKRDLSILVDKSISFTTIKKAILDLDIKEIKRVYPADLYEDDSLGDKISLTIRTILQSNEATLEEAQISGAMNKILNVLEDKIGATLR